MSTLLARYRALKFNKTFYLQLLIAILLFSFSMFLNYYANNYTLIHSSSSVSDIVLDNIRTYQVDDIFYEGGLIFFCIVCFLGLYKPHRIPFMLKSIGVFFVVRSFFLILTHLAPPLHGSILPTNNFVERLIAGSGDDLFFSGHTGFPFLMALLFWDNLWLRLGFIATCVLFGTAALLGHLHYSIDVFSAFFITYGIYHIAVRLFKKDYIFFQQEL